MRFTEMLMTSYAMFRSGDYKGALALLEREGGNFPTQVARIGQWKAAAYGAMGEPEKALAVLNEVVAAGGWLSERMLSYSPELKGIAQLPGYSEFIAVCRQRQAEARAAIKPELLTRFDASSPGPAPLVLALHGNMASAVAASYDWAPLVDQGCFLGLAQSTDIDGPDIYFWDDWGKAERQVQAHFATLSADPAVDQSRAVLGGFSMGGGLAAWLGLKGALSVRGFIVLGPYIPQIEVLRAEMAGARERGLRGYIIVGDQDGLCLPHARALCDLMRQSDIPVEMEIVPGLGHVAPPDFGERLARAMAFILR